MSTRFILGIGVLLAALPLSTQASLGAPAADNEPVLQEREHKSLGELLSKWIAAHSDPRTDRVEAQEDLREEFGKLEKRRTGDRPMLALTHDLGRVLWHAQGYAGQRVRPGMETVDTKATGFGSPLQYAISVPSAYKPRGGVSYPLLLILPDVETPGQPAGPSQFLTENFKDAALRDGALLVSVGMPKDPETWDQLGAPGAAGGVAAVLTVYSEVTRKYAVNFDRIYLVGHGAGVAAAMAIAEKFPDRFAGVIGRRGDAAELPAGNFRNLPTLFAGGGARASAFEEACKAAGHENVTVAPDADEADIWAWIEKHPRQANPQEVVLVPGAPFPNKAYWIEVPASDGATPATVNAKVDRESNTITIDAQGVAEVTVYFNDVLVDLDRAIKVVCNGKEQPEEIIPRNFNTFLDLVFGGRNDPGKIHVARKRYDVSQ